MDDGTGALEKLNAAMAKAELTDMSSVKIGDIIYVPLDEEDGLILKDGYDKRNKYIVIIGFYGGRSCHRCLAYKLRDRPFQEIPRTTKLPIPFIGT